MLVVAERWSALDSAWLKSAIVGLLVAYPALTLIVPGAVNTAIFLLFLMSLGLLLSPRLLHAFKGVNRHQTLIARVYLKDPLDQSKAILFSLSMIGLPAAVFVSQWANHRWGWPYYDAVSRFLIAIPIFFALRRFDPALLINIRRGFLIGAFVAAGYVIFDPQIWGADKGIVRIGTSFVNPIHFGDIALSLGIIPLFGIIIQEKKSTAKPWLHLSLALLATAAGLYASILSGSRGGWVSIPALLIVAYLINRKKFPALAALVVFIVISVVFYIGYEKIPEIQQRINLIHNNIHAFDQGNENTSIGIRFQLWRVALMIFIDHPIFGIGMGGFKELMNSLQQAGYLTPLAADFGRQEVHSEILSRLSQLGVIGFIAIMSVYIVPGWMFWAQLNAPMPASRSAARMGLAFVIGFFIYGLTVETFDLTMTAAFYALTIAVLMAVAYPATKTKNTNEIQHPDSVME